LVNGQGTSFRLRDLMSKVNRCEQYQVGSSNTFVGLRNLGGGGGGGGGCGDDDDDDDDDVGINRAFVKF